MLSEAAGAISGIKAALDIAKGMNAALSAAQTLELKAGLLERLSEASISAIEAASALEDARARERALEAEIVRLTDWSASADQFELREVGQRASHAYLPIGASDDSKSGQWHCPHCFSERRKSLMHVRDVGMFAFLFCHACGLELDLQGRRPADSTKGGRR